MISVLRVERVVPRDTISGTTNEVAMQISQTVQKLKGAAERLTTGFNSVSYAVQEHVPHVRNPALGCLAIEDQARRPYLPFTKLNQGTVIYRTINLCLQNLLYKRGFLSRDGDTIELVVVGLGDLLSREQQVCDGQNGKYNNRKLGNVKCVRRHCYKCTGDVGTQEKR